MCAFLPGVRATLMPRQVKSSDFHEFFTVRKKYFHAGLLLRLRISLSFNKGSFALRLIEEREMNSTSPLTCGTLATTLPPLRQPKPETADHGTVRLGSGMITAGFPAHR